MTFLYNASVLDKYFPLTTLNTWWALLHLRSIGFRQPLVHKILTKLLTLNKADSILLSIQFRILLCRRKKEKQPIIIIYHNMKKFEALKTNTRTAQNDRTKRPWEDSYGSESILTARFNSNYGPHHSNCNCCSCSFYMSIPYQPAKYFKKKHESSCLGWILKFMVQTT